MDLHGKTVLVTGGTGSFGQRVHRVRARRVRPRAIVVFSRDELSSARCSSASRTTRACASSSATCATRDRLRCAFRGVDVVVHAAALKQVPACEYNPFEAIQTNIIGAENVIDAAIDNGVQRRSRCSAPTRPPTRSTSTARPSSAADKLFAPGQRLRGDSPHALLGRALRQRRRQPRQRVPLFEAPGARGPAADHRRAHDALLDHARAGRATSCSRASSGCTAARSSCPRSRACASIDLAEALAPGRRAPRSSASGRARSCTR